MGTGSLLGLKRPGRGVDHPPPSVVEAERSRAVYTSTPAMDLHGLLYGEIYFYLIEYGARRR